MNRMLILFLFFAQHSLAQMTPRKVDLVNPFIGTGGHGHTFPGPTMPFGACQLSPDTRLEGWDGCGGYHYSDSVIYGFSHTHLSGTGCSDYGDILLMPVTKHMSLDKYQYASHFLHASEKAHAGYYSVFLEKPKVNVELTTTLHGGIHSYTYRKSDPMYVVLDLKHRDEVLDSRIEQVDEYTIRGYRFSKAWAQNQKVFYEIQFSRKIESIQYEQKKEGSNTSAIDIQKSYQCIIKLEGNTKKPNPASANSLMVKCAISGVDEDGAHKNLIAEMPHWDFKKYLSACENEWERELSKIQISEFENLKMSQFEHEKQPSHNAGVFKSSNLQIDKLVVFYSALYHCMIHPSLYNDVDGRYRGRDDKIYNTNGKFDYYTVFSLWDTYRALHPLLTILDKKRTNDFINTFIKQYEQVGRLPIWELSSNETNCMIGYHVVSVIWDAYNKGIRDYDANKAYEAMTTIATHFSHYEGSGLDMKLKEAYRQGAADADALESYCKFGYVRADDSHESVSKTLEYAYDDWCIAQMAKALGKEVDYEYYLSRSRNWMNVFDPTTGFMRARKNGCLYEPFSPYMVDNNYTEANSWQYSFYVPHDLNRFYSLFGKSNRLSTKLNDLFSADQKTEGREQSDITGLIGQYAHGNEPSHHIAYLYNYGGACEETSNKVNYIKEKFYLNTPDGLIGNEDCGQMSAWYVMSAMGIYPVCPGNENYQITEPSFDRIVINGNITLLKDKPVTKSNFRIYYRIKKRNEISHFNLISGKQHTFEYNVTNGTNCGIPPYPLLFSEAVPFILNASRNFKDSLQIVLKSIGNQSMYYSLDKKDCFLYEKPFHIFDNTEVTFFTYQNEQIGMAKSRKGPCLSFAIPNSDTKIQTATFTKLPDDRKVSLKSIYNKSYSAGGPEAMIDGIFGKLNWRAGDWQGYQGQDVEVIIEFNEPRAIKKLGANFLEDQNSWIFYPKKVAFFVSKDGKNWTQVNEIETNKSDKELKVTISKFETPFRELKPEVYKYAKMIATNFGPMPQWHEGRGNPTFIFIDEFEVK